MSVNAWIEEIVGATPAAGAGFVRRVPGETFEQYLTIRCQLVTSAVVANRFPSIAWSDGDGNEYRRVTVESAIAASTTAILTWSKDIDVAAAAAANIFMMPLPAIWVPSGHSIAIAVTGEDVGDQLSAIRMWTKRQPTGPMYPATGAEPVDPLEWGVG